MKRLTLVISIIAVCLLLPVGSSFVFGDSDGYSSDSDLYLESSNPADDAADVPLDVIIQLNFTKNICNVLVFENNSTCYHLTSEDGEVIPITVTVPDDQVQRDIKRCVFIDPDEDLLPDTSYRISVDNMLMAKNGNTIDNAYQITFTTGKKAGAPTPELLLQLGDNTRSFQSELPENENSVPMYHFKPSLTLILLTLALILAVLIVLVGTRRRAV